MQSADLLFGFGSTSVRERQQQRLKRVRSMEPEAGSLSQGSSAECSSDAIFPPAKLITSRSNGELTLGLRLIAPARPGAAAVCPPQSALSPGYVHTGENAQSFRDQDFSGPEWRAFLANFAGRPAAPEPEVRRAPMQRARSTPEMLARLGSCKRAEELRAPVMPASRRISQRDEYRIADLAISGYSASAIADRFRTPAGERISDDLIKFLCKIYAPRDAAERYRANALNHKLFVGPSEPLPRAIRSDIRALHEQKMTPRLISAIVEHPDGRHIPEARIEIFLQSERSPEPPAISAKPNDQP